MQAASEQRGDALRARVLAAARRICLACSQYQTEVEWHRRASKEADRREHELRQQLYTILDLINGHKAPEKREKLAAVPRSDPIPQERTAAQSVKPPSLWQRIKSFLGQRWALWFTEQDLSVAFVAGWARPMAEEVKPLAAASSLLECPTATTSFAEKRAPQEQPPPSLVVYCLGPFRVYQDDHPVKDWPSSKGKAIFKYLVTHRERPVAKEVLMELHWPDAHPDAARNNLNVAIYGLRQALRTARPSFSHVLYQDDCYLLNPNLKIWVDYEAFTEHLAAGQTLERLGDLTLATREYHAAEALYQGEFLEEDRYEDWPALQRQHLQDDFLDLLERLSLFYLDHQNYAACATLCHKMLAVDTCYEKVYRRLMRCYSQQGQPYLALRQYHLCVDRLREELDVAPAPATTQLYELIRRRKGI